MILLPPHARGGGRHLTLVLDVPLSSIVVLFAVCFGVEILCCLHMMYVFIFLFSSGNRVAAYLGITARSAYDMVSQYKYLIFN